MLASQAIRRLQREIVENYAADVGLAPDARYYGGARLRPLPPLDTAVGGVMFIGAYPSARFETVGTERDVPVGDNLGPFEPERYFDGQTVRTQRSADELTQLFLGPLGLDRVAQCWITDIVKVFLFKAGHRRTYHQLGTQHPDAYEREAFGALAKKSLPWLRRELALANPAVVITLGAEVAGAFRGVEKPAAQSALLTGEITECDFQGLRLQAVHLAHPES